MAGISGTGLVVRTAVRRVRADRESTPAGPVEAPTGTTDVVVASGVAPA
jgi:hypothetical protein